ncbi:MAG: EAL domain-containing protein [Pseudomonadota bacterium]
MLDAVRMYRLAFSLADRFIGLADTALMRERVRSRAIVFWTFFAVPVGLFITVYQQAITPSSIAGMVGVLGILAAVGFLKITKNSTGAGFIFGASSVFGLGFEPLVTGNTMSASLVLVAVTPVIFGFLVNWRRCMESAVALLFYFPLVYLSWQYGAPDLPGSVTYLFACAAATFACGFSIGMSSLATSRTASRLRMQRQQIKQLALTDPLTGLANRRAFNESLAIAPTLGHVVSRSLILIDLNGFKSINDRFGHDVGDGILTQTSNRIEAILAGAASLYRLGSDEFAIIYDRCEEAVTPDALAQSLLKVFDHPFQLEALSLSVSCSMGCETISSDTCVQKLLLRNADIALFEAKLAPSGTCRHFSRDLGDRIERRRALLERLPEAISNHQIDVVYQPQHRITDGTVLGFEALSRWTDAKYGTVPPEEFVQLAEETGLVSGLDRAMIRTAIEQAEDWLSPNITLSINVSGATLVSAGFVQFVDDVVSAFALSPDQVQMEITETAFIDKWETARDTILALNDMGVSLALDDFGTGYSSLSYLSAFPIDLLKIDRSFLRNAHQKTNIKVMQSIMNLAGSLGLDVLIEGVETEHHLSMVKLLGCQKVQGYFYSKPLSGDDCGLYLEAHAHGAIEKLA